MSLRSYFTRRSITPHWRYTTDHTLWRIMFSRSGSIIGEDRDTELKTASFFCLDAANGRVRWKERRFSEAWWIGLEGVTDRHIYFHGFRKPDMPEHWSIICIDAGTGDELWRNNECAFLTADEEHVFGYKDLFERRVYYRLDGQTGTVLEELNVLPPGLESGVSLEKTDFTFPQPFNGDDGETEIATAAMIQSIVEPDSTTEYIQTDSALIIGTYAGVKEQEGARIMKNTLTVADRSNGSVLYTDILQKETPYPVPDSFFMDESILYYIKERRTLTAVDLRQQS